MSWVEDHFVIGSYRHRFTGGWIDDAVINSWATVSVSRPHLAAACTVVARCWQQQANADARHGDRAVVKFFQVQRLAKSPGRMYPYYWGLSEYPFNTAQDRPKEATVPKASRISSVVLTHTGVWQTHTHTVRQTHAHSNKCRTSNATICSGCLVYSFILFI